MKKLLTFLMVFAFFSCQKDKDQLADLQIEERASVAQVTAPSGYTIGDTSKRPNLYIPISEAGWAYNPLVGLYPGFKSITAINDTSVEFGYACYIANGIKNFDAAQAFPFDYSGNKDFVSCRPCDRVADPYSTRDYNFPGMLSVKAYGFGKVVSTLEKQNFYVGPNYTRVGFDFLKQISYNWFRSDTMYIPWGCGDNYFNRITLPATGGVVKEGYYVVKVHVNPDSVIRESDYSDNISYLPVYVQGTSVRVDTNALNVAPQAPSFNECKIQRGKLKGVSLKWEGEADAYCVERNGVMIVKWLYGKQYLDINGTTNDSYRIISRVEYNRRLGGYTDFKKPSRK